MRVKLTKTAQGRVLRRLIPETPADVALLRELVKRRELAANG